MVPDEQACCLVVGGDFAPIGRNAGAFQRGDGRALFGDLLDDFVSADFSVVNLECPLTRVRRPIMKSGVSLAADPCGAHSLAAAHIGAVNLANNHIMDHGTLGLEETIGAVGGVGVLHCGAGNSTSEASQPVVFSHAGVGVAIVGVAEHEFGVASRESPGVNPLDLIDLVRGISDWRERVDHVIVLLHGGAEHYPYPSPELQRTCRFLAEQGASAVICQHSHCPGSYELHRGAPLVYGQGNLLFDLPWPSQSEWYRGFLIKLRLFAGPRSTELEIVPFVQSRGRAGIHRMGQAEEVDFGRDLQERSAVLNSEQDLARLWKEHCAHHRETYLSALRGHGSLVRKINRLVPFAGRFLSQQAKCALLNVIRCESHREAVLSILEDLCHE